MFELYRKLVQPDLGYISELVELKEKIVKTMYCTPFMVGLVVYIRAERQCGFVPFYHIFCIMFVHVYSSHASPGGHEY